MKDSIKMTKKKAEVYIHTLMVTCKKIYNLVMRENIYKISKKGQER